MRTVKPDQRTTRQGIIVPLPPNVVPKPLIPLFRGGGIKQILDFAEKFGTGLAFINNLGRVFPRDPSVPFWYYQQLTSWISNFAKQALAAGDYLNSLSLGTQIDPNVLPRNFYLKRPDYQMCNNFLRVSYTSINPSTGTEYSVQRGFWINELSDMGTLKRELMSRIQNELDIVSVSAHSQRKYKIKQDSIEVTAAVRLC